MKRNQCFIDSLLIYSESLDHFSIDVYVFMYLMQINERVGVFVVGNCYTSIAIAAVAHTRDYNVGITVPSRPRFDKTPYCMV